MGSEQESDSDAFANNLRLSWRTLRMGEAGTVGRRSLANRPSGANPAAPPRMEAHRRNGRKFVGYMEREELK